MGVAAIASFRRAMASSAPPLSMLVGVMSAAPINGFLTARSLDAHRLGESEFLQDLTQLRYQALGSGGIYRD